MVAITSNTLFTLIATLALLAAPTTSLPTRGSTSSIGRRSRLARRQLAVRQAIPSAPAASHNINIDASSSSGISNSTFNINIVHPATTQNPKRSLVPPPVTANPKHRRSTEGDNSIVVDVSSTTESGEGAGISDSTVNLTVISRWVKMLKRRVSMRSSTGSAAEQVAAYEAAIASLRSSAPAVPISEPTQTLVSDPVPVPSSSSDLNNVLSDAPSSQPSSSPVVHAYIASFQESRPLILPSGESASSAGTNVTTSLEATPIITLKAPQAVATGGPVTLTVTLVPAGPNGSYVDAALLPNSNSSLPVVTSLPSSASTSTRSVVSKATRTSSEQVSGPVPTASMVVSVVGDKVVRFSRHVRRNTRGKMMITH